MSDQKLIISFGGLHPAKVTEECALTWDELVARLTSKVPETLDKASAGWFCPVQFSPQYRDSENFVARYALTLDYDHVTAADRDAIMTSMREFTYLLYHTWSSTDAQPRFRIVMPLSRPCTYDEFQAVSRSIAARAGIELAARESHVPSQMMFLPSVKPGVEFSFSCYAQDNGWINVDEILGKYFDWTDRREWPHRADGDGVHSQSETKVQPDEKPGIVGDFCRAFNIPQAIEEFDLPYTPTANEDRWTYTDGSRPEGAIIYDDGRKLHSHHDTDPARGQTNAFDLVRLHRFGDLDAGCDAATPITERPSYQAMAQLTNRHPRVLEKRASQEFQPLGDLPLELQQAEKSSIEVRFRVVPANEFDIPGPREWLIEGVLPYRAGLGAIYGESGSGKSAKVYDMCAAITRGVDWRGLKTRKGRAVYVCAEGQHDFRYRVAAYARHYNCDRRELPGIIPATPNLLETEDVSALITAIGAYGGADVIVIDTWAASLPGDENSSKDAGRALIHCGAIHAATGALVLLVAHAGKDATRGMRGWSGIKAACDVEIEVVRQGDARTASITKHKGGQEGQKFGFRLKTVMLGLDENGRPFDSVVVEPTEVVTTVRKSEPSGLWDKATLKTAREMMMNVPSVPREMLAETASHALPPTERGDRYSKADSAIQKLCGEGFLFFDEFLGTISLTSAKVLDNKDFEND